ncbi:DUF4269 domain-containing protein [Paenibacillus taichungensis]|uniref:DUF4269 domain-containing protein n=1 Tax=Paenibacillus taichungensis TaxID=484184 RepID=UPI002DC01DA1|nr:DUF4269 domain-containing protein [Paenibacillus taichungensis]MEC0110540.1 DUF4269 domain-containing protein [Paenibacillus taichungensis]MEC0197744.1 DUF4269 domain-containing protein [Paenibacillus taichungensis]
MITTTDVMVHLASGNERQQDAYKVLQSSGLFSILAAYQPYPAGTVPIDIDIPGSDLDLLCEAADLEAFETLVYQQLSGMQGFRCDRGDGRAGKRPYVTCSMEIGNWPIEIFAQSLSVRKQNAYIHMLVEWELLQLWGAAGHREIRKLKLEGWKTEPAFAAVLGLQGDPYEEMLHLASLSKDELWQWARLRTSFQFE